MSIKVSTTSKGYNTDNELVIHVHPDGYGYGQIKVDGDSENLDIKIVPKGTGDVVVNDLYVTGLSGTVTDKINSINTILSTISVSGTELTLPEITTSVESVDNRVDDVELQLNDIINDVSGLVVQGQEYQGGIVTDTIIASGAKNNKIAFSFKVEDTKLVGIETHEGLPAYKNVLGMSAFVEETGKQYYASDKGWIPLQSENIYKTVFLTDEFSDHAQYATISPEDAKKLLFNEVDVVTTESSSSCVPIDHFHVVSWYKNGSGKIVARLEVDNHPSNPHTITEESIGVDILTTAIKNGLDENSVFQTCTLSTVDPISGSVHTHKSTITVKQALNLFKNQREWIKTDVVEVTESTDAFYDVDDANTLTGESIYGKHKHNVTWKYEAGLTGIIRNNHLGQYSNGDNPDDELHKYSQYDFFGHIKPCSTSINAPVENGNTHTHEITYTKSIINDIFTSLEATKFNKTGGIIHGRVGIRDGFTYIDAVQPTSGSSYEMVIGTNSTVATNPTSGALSASPYYDRIDNDAVKIGDDYVSIMNSRNLSVGEFGYGNTPIADIHVKRANQDAKILVETDGSYTPSLDLCNSLQISGSNIGGSILVKTAGTSGYDNFATGEMIIHNKVNKGVSIVSGPLSKISLGEDGNVRVTGDLIIDGDTTFTQSSEVFFSDNILELNSISGSANIQGSSLQTGLRMKRGDGIADYLLLYDEQAGSLVVGFDGSQLSSLVFQEGNIIETAGIPFGSGNVPGATTDAYTQNTSNFRYTISGGMFINTTGDYAIDVNSNKIANLADGTVPSDAINLGQLTSAIGAISTSHNDLTDLGSDDHTQYLRTDGDRSATGILSYNTHPSFTQDTQLIDKKYVDDLSSSLGGNLGGHTGDTSIHFTEASIDHMNIQNIGTNTHAQIDVHISGADIHIADNSLHFTEGSINHANIQNIGIHSHGQIDSKIIEYNAHAADTTIHYTQESIDHNIMSNLTIGDPHNQYLHRISGGNVPALTTFDNLAISNNGSLGYTISVSGSDDLVIRDSSNNVALSHNGTLMTVGDVTIRGVAEASEDNDAMSKLQTEQTITYETLLTNGDIDTDISGGALPSSIPDTQAMKTYVDNKITYETLLDNGDIDTNLADGASPSSIPNSQAVKAYVDANAGGGSGGGNPLGGQFWTESFDNTGDVVNFANTYVKGNKGLLVFADGIMLAEGVDYLESPSGINGDEVNDIELINDFDGFIGEIIGRYIGGYSIISDSTLTGAGTSGAPLSITPGQFTPAAHESDTSAHGVSSAIVGVSDSQTLTNKTINADSNTISNLELDNLKSGVLDTDITSVSSSHDTIASAKSIRDYFNSYINQDVRSSASPTFGASSKIGNTRYETGSIELNIDGSGDRNAYLDFWSHTGANDYDARIIRTQGVNSDFNFQNKGTGKMKFWNEVSGGGYQFNPSYTDNDFQVYGNASNKYFLWDAANGRFGINRNDAEYALDVNGQARFNSGLKGTTIDNTNSIDGASLNNSSVTADKLANGILSKNFICYVKTELIGVSSGSYLTSGNIGTRINVADSNYNDSSFTFDFKCTLHTPLAGYGFTVNGTIAKDSGTSDVRAILHGFSGDRSGIHTSHGTIGSGNMTTSGSIVSLPNTANTNMESQIGGITLTRLHVSNELCFTIHFTRGTLTEADLFASIAGTKLYAGADISSSNGFVV